MTWIVDTFRRYPELAIFLTLALGNWLGSRKLGSFSLGPVTGVLLAGVLVGQMEIAISPHVKATFFIMFLFAVGYGVGPQFFRGFKQDGVPQALFAVLQCVVSLLTVVGLAKLFGYGPGTAAGLLSGSNTMSSVLGVASDAIARLPLAAEQKAAMIDDIPVAYAVTYLFGTAGAAWLLSTLGPRLMRVDLVESCRELETALGSAEPEPGVISAARRFDVRSYRVANPGCFERTASQIEQRMKGQRAFIERIRHDDEILPAEPESIVRSGDVVAVVGRREVLVEWDLAIGPEVHDFELMDFPAEALEVVITNKSVVGKTIHELAAGEISGVEARGVYLRSLVRGGEQMPVTSGTTLNRGDVVQVIGSQRNVLRIAGELGYADRATNMTDMISVGAGIVLGGLLGALTIRVAGIELSLSTSVGALIAGLVFGWLRSVNRAFGRVPAPALWLLNHLGLTVFIAVVGIGAGPSFVHGLRETGFSLLLAGMIATTLPLVSGVLMARYLFRFHPGIALGATAGAQTTTAALAMVENVCQSKVPALGYTVPFAVGAILLTLWGLVVVLVTQ